MSGAIVGGIIAGAAALGSNYLSNRAQDKASRRQADAQKQAYELQERQQSLNEQEQKKANADRVNAGAILGETAQNNTEGILTSGSGIDPNSLNLGTSATLGAKAPLGTQSTLGNGSTLGRNYDDDLLF